METRRDDFGIAFRSAFLQKGAKQKFSLLVLIFFCFLFLFFEKANFQFVSTTRALVQDGIYRASYLVSLPQNLFKLSSKKIKQHFFVYDENKKLVKEIYEYKNNLYNIEFLQTENKNLKKLLDETKLTNDKFVISKVLLDKDSPFIHSIIINKGVNDGIKKGMPVLDFKFLIGRIVEANYKSSRVLLLNDLNSRLPIVISPNGYQAILCGANDKLLCVDYLPKDHNVKTGDKIYTSGKDGIFAAGIPVGEIKKNSENEVKAELFSDPYQLNFVSVITSGPLIEKITISSFED